MSLLLLFTSQLAAVQVASFVFPRLVLQWPLSRRSRLLPFDVHIFGGFLKAPSGTSLSHRG